eukprot:5210621-Alexandrium_andersonii.AAC.1
MRWPSRISFGWGQNVFEETGGEAAARQGCEGRKGAMGREKGRWVAGRCGCHATQRPAFRAT